MADEEFANAYADEFLNMRIATQLKTLREQRHYTQKYLAELAGMKQERISVLENVNYSSWSINTLRKLAAALGVTLRVSFETFGSCLADMKTFSRESLERQSRAEELKEDQKRDAAQKRDHNMALPYRPSYEQIGVSPRTSSQDMIDAGFPEDSVSKLAAYNPAHLQPLQLPH